MYRFLYGVRGGGGECEKINVDGGTIFGLETPLELANGHRYFCYYGRMTMNDEVISVLCCGRTEEAMYLVIDV